MAIIHAIGEPENESERKAISYLAEHLPGKQYVIFHNLELPTPSGLPYEYDIILVGEYAVYMLEVKGYRGLIRGNAHEWEFESGAIYKSPIPLANKKAKILGELLHRNPLFKEVWVQPLIVLSDERARIQMHTDEAKHVLHLDETVHYILAPTHLPVAAKPHPQLTNLISDAIFKRFRPLHRQHEIGEFVIQTTVNKNTLYTTLVAENRFIRNRHFTLKVYDLNIYTTQQARNKQREWITRDANALHRLENHPNIIKAYNPFPWQDNQIVLPLEWIDGYSLQGLLEAKTPMSLARKVDVIRQVCAGLQYAHEHGVIHRNLQPENIIIPMQGPVKLVNFDCARIEDNDMPTIGTRVDKQLNQMYVAPEVWHNASAASPTSDLYALGIIFFELLTGQAPYKKMNEIVFAKGLPARATQINPALPPQVDAVIERLCAMNVADRYASAAEATKDLEAIANYIWHHAV